MTRPSFEEIQLSATENSFRDKVILITGASDGIGKAAALEFSQLGAHVILLARNQDKLGEVFDQIESESDTRPIILPCDLSQLTHENAKEMAYAIEQEYGRLDAIIHNASVLGSKMSIAQYPPAQWLEVMNINLNSAFFLTQALLPLLEASPCGRIIFTSSSVGRKGRAYWGAYAVSKFATEGFMETLADELKATSDIKVFAVNPGGTRTPMRAKAYPGEDPATVPAPEEHMPLYRYLLSENSSAWHGCSLDARDFLS